MKDCFKLIPGIVNLVKDVLLVKKKEGVSWPLALQKNAARIRIIVLFTMNWMNDIDIQPQQPVSYRYCLHGCILSVKYLTINLMSIHFEAEFFLLGIFFFQVKQ